MSGRDDGGPAVWSLVNPSDRVTFRSDDFEALAFGVMILSNGGYCIEEEGADEPRKSPILLFGTDPNEWWQETFGHPVDGFKPWQARVCAALNTYAYGDRVDYEAAVSAIDDPDKCAAFIADWNDRHRTSMNNIGRAISAWTAKLAANAAEARP